MKKLNYFLKDVDSVARQLALQIQDCSIVTLSGALGAGKTTLSGALLAQLGVREPVISPTFTYLNMYKSSDGKMIYHFDLYRLKNMQEFERLGFFEYLDQEDSLVLIEWPEIIQSALQGNICHVKLSVIDDLQRQIEYNVNS